MYRLEEVEEILEDEYKNCFYSILFYHFQHNYPQALKQGIIRHKRLGATVLIAASASSNKLIFFGVFLFGAVGDSSRKIVELHSTKLSCIAVISSPKQYKRVITAKH